MSKKLISKMSNNLNVKITSLITLMCVTFMTSALCSCKSSPKFEGTGDLCGMIVDSNNNPISNFSVSCKKESKEGKKNSAYEKLSNEGNTVFTNESGIFVFNDLPSGKYILSGKKNGYVLLNETEYDFVERGKIFCCQIDEINKVLDDVEKMILLREYEKAITLLKTVYVEDYSYEEDVIESYLDLLIAISE